MQDDYMTLDPKGHATHTFSDLPFDEAFELAKQMPEHSTPSFREPLTYPGYNDVRSALYRVRTGPDYPAPVPAWHD